MKTRTAAKRVGLLLACTLAAAGVVRSAKPIAATSGRALVALGTAAHRLTTGEDVDMSSLAASIGCGCDDCSSAPAAAKHLVTAQAATTTHSVTVNAHDHSVPVSGSGFDSGITVTAGQTLTATASTDACWAAGDSPHTSDANGLGACTSTTCANSCDTGFGKHSAGGDSFYYGTLVGKVGDGDWFAIGTDFSGEMIDSGTLYMGYWDSNNGDNSGEIPVTITLSSGAPASAAPSAAPTSEMYWKVFWTDGSMGESYVWTTTNELAGIKATVLVDTTGFANGVCSESNITGTHTGARPPPTRARPPPTRTPVTDTRAPPPTRALATDARAPPPKPV